MLDDWYLKNLVCPVTRKPLRYQENRLSTDCGRQYPVVDGLPVMLVKEQRQTMTVASRGIDCSHGKVTDNRMPHLFLETLGISESEKDELVKNYTEFKIDPVVVMIVGATSGYAYKDLIGSTKLDRYPIPSIKLEQKIGAKLLDIGCNWGRWSIAAATKGYRVTGIDPSLGAVLAARRVSREFGLDIKFVVGDGRYLPFEDNSYDSVYSYSVVQHLSESDAKLAIGETARVVVPAGTTKIQMANKYGLRSFQHQMKRKFRDPKDFEVRYWTPKQLGEMYRRNYSSIELVPECYFGLGWLEEDRSFLNFRNRVILTMSKIALRLANAFPYMATFADSIFVVAKDKR
jgi:ubiquinone/menaquinone biosynthesis C-methylase UbiE/uncharacterized protein YbaR (Trm112 family)